jgi:hypothetical protein
MIEFFTILILIIVLFNIFKERKIYKYFLFITIFIFIIFDGLRWETGTDWDNYKYSFDNALDLKFNFELGYTFYIFILRSITNNYSIFLLVTSLIFYSIIFYKVFLFSKYSFFSILYLIATLPWYSGAIRQMLSLIFFLYAIEFCIKKKFLKFLFSILLGISFHTLMFLNLFLYLIYDITFLSFLSVCLFLLILLFTFKSFIIQIQQLLDIIRPEKSYETYLSGGSSTNGNTNFFLGISRKFYTYSVLYIFSGFKFKNNIYFNFFLHLSLFSILTYIIGTFLIAGFSSRADIYYGLIATAILVGLIENRLKSKWKKILFLIFIITLLVINYYRLEYLDLFHPYKSIFYNINYNRDLY